MYKFKFSPKLILFGILLIAAGFRFYNLNWDQGQHLHPDERFLTMVGSAMKIPGSFLQYLDPLTSLFNPTNIGYKFFVYGTFPVILNKLLAVWIGADNYNDFAILGRQLSAFFDLLIVLLVFKATALLEREYKYPPSLKFLAAFFYAITVLPIQLSHFGTVDTPLNFFVFASFYFMFSFYSYGSKYSLLISAISFGLALSTKISAIFILPLLLFLLFYYFKNQSKLAKNKNYQRIIIEILFCLLIFGIVVYATVRLANPYYFETGNILSPQVNKLFLENIKQLKSWEGKDIWFPPSVQWMNKQPVITSLKDLSIFGLGLTYFILVIYGLYLIFNKYKRVIIVTTAVWVLLFFLYQSTQFVKTMRYFIIIYPFLAIYAAIGLYSITKKTSSLFQLLLLILLFAWPLSFLSIYHNTNSRIQASQWIYQNIPSGSAILNEHWDDPLPLLLPSMARQLPGDLLPVFDPDTPDKWNKMDVLLGKGEYLIFSSNRGWGSIPTVPEKYPLMSKFYKDLFTGRLAYKKIKEFTSYPSLAYLGIPITFPDDWADESFTVYDHPKVMIFKR